MKTETELDKIYDEMNKRKTSAVLRTDGPIRVNSFGTAVGKGYFVYNKAPSGFV